MARPDDTARPATRAIRAGRAASGASGTEFVYDDRTGALDGFRHFEVATGSGASARAQLEFVNLAGLDGSQTLDAVLRIGDDCWSAAFGCEKGRCTRTVELP